MFGLLAIIGNLLLPVLQIVRRAGSFRTEATEEASDSPSKETPASGLDQLAQALEYDDQAYLLPHARALPPGAFPQLDLDLERHSGATNWAVRSADPSINAPARLTDTFAERTRTDNDEEQRADPAYSLLVHTIVQDNNGLTVPQLEQAALDSLAHAQTYFKAAMFTEVDVKLIDTTSAQIEWSGAMADGIDGFYYPMVLTVTDRAGFEQDFVAQVPILLGEPDL